MMSPSVVWRCREHVLRLLGHVGELRAIGTAVGHFVHNDQVMLGLDCHLHVAADDPGTATARRRPALVEAKVQATVGRDRRGDGVLDLSFA